jgi:hypothetical protein
VERIEKGSLYDIWHLTYFIVTTLESKKKESFGTIFIIEIVTLIAGIMNKIIRIYSFESFYFLLIGHKDSYLMSRTVWLQHRVTKT